jgi:hypothetical protein
MKTVFLFSTIALGVLLMSFNRHRDPNATKTAAGVYGVSAEALPFTFELSLNADNTFHYVNNSVPGKAIDTKGTWEQKGNTITLSHYTSEFPINDKWKMDSYHCLKSRKGLEFTRLCNISTAVK